MQQLPSHMTMCYFYAPLKAEASAILALGPSAKILYTAPIPLWCVWLLDGSTRKPQQHYYLSIYTYKCNHTHHFSKPGLFLICI